MSTEKLQEIQDRMEAMMDAAEMEPGEALMLVTTKGIKLIIPQETEPDSLEEIELNDFQKLAITFAKLSQEKTFRSLLLDMFDTKLMVGSHENITNRTVN